MTAVFGEHPREFFAPARNWLADDVHLIYLEYYYRYQLLEAALAEFTSLGSFRAYWRGLPMMLKAMRHGFKALI